MAKRLKIDPQIVAPYEVPALEVFADTWEHVLSAALMYSVRMNRRGFSKTEAVYKQAAGLVKKYETETLTLEVVTDLVADWVGAKPKGNPTNPKGNPINKEETILAWAADPATQAILAADQFGRAYFVAVSSRPQMALPI